MKYIYNFIMKESIKSNIVANYEDPIPLISLLLEQFKKGCKKFQYFNILRHLIHKQESNPVKSNCKYHINKKQLKLFFNLTFAKVIPLNMFGKLKNFLKVLKAIFHLLYIPCFILLSLRPFIEKLDLCNCTILTKVIHSMNLHYKNIFIYFKYSVICFK